MKQYAESKEMDFLVFGNGIAGRMCFHSTAATKPHARSSSSNAFSLGSGAGVAPKRDSAFSAKPFYSVAAWS
jgi:hypothetical protein